MGWKFWEFLRPKNGVTSTKEIPCRELFEAAQEYQIRELCFWICVEMIANALGRCEFRTFRGGKEIFERDYYLLNYEPNQNQNSTAFMHKLVSKLYRENEALVISVKKPDGYDSLMIADSWEPPREYAFKQNEYAGVVVGETQFYKTFLEEEVLHLKLNQKNIKPVVDRLCDSYSRLISSAAKSYQWNHGQHWKVHVDQLAQGGDGWAAKYQEMISEQFKPFLNSDGAILPEFDGYRYENAGGDGSGDTRDIKNLMEDIFDFTARGFLIPVVLVNGKVEATEDANVRLLSNCVDPLCDQLQEEIVRKRYGYDEWKRGNYLRIDSSSIIHFDLFANAANVEKLIGTGAFTINDVRRAAGQAAIMEPWADQSFMTKNIAPIEDVADPLGDGEEGGIE